MASQSLDSMRFPSQGIFLQQEMGIAMKRGQHAEPLDAFALFPDLMKNQHRAVRQKKKKKARVLPPPPPDLSWLRTGIYEEQEQAGDIPTALVLMSGEQDNDSISSSLKDLGYQVETADTSFEALDRLRSNSFAAILMHTEFEGKSPAESTVHTYITRLSIKKRRTIFYILTGPNFQTMYDIEALSLSVNLVINDTEIQYLKQILRKSFHDHEELFGPLIEILEGSGNQQ